MRRGTTRAAWPPSRSNSTRWVAASGCSGSWNSWSALSGTGRSPLRSRVSAARAWSGSEVMGPRRGLARSGRSLLRTATRSSTSEGPEQTSTAAHWPSSGTSSRTRRRRVVEVRSVGTSTVEISATRCSWAVRSSRAVVRASVSSAALRCRLKSWKTSTRPSCRPPRTKGVVAQMMGTVVPSARWKYSSLPSSAGPPCRGRRNAQRSRGTGLPSACRCRRSCASCPSMSCSDRPSRCSAQGFTEVIRAVGPRVRTPAPRVRRTAREKSGSGAPSAPSDVACSGSSPSRWPAQRDVTTLTAFRCRPSRQVPPAGGDEPLRAAEGGRSGRVIRSLRRAGRRTFA
ncbi:hypothetical protein RKD40_007051 [Streptomyces ambofaciens]